VRQRVASIFDYSLSSILHPRFVAGRFRHPLSSILHSRFSFILTRGVADDKAMLPAIGKRLLAELGENRE
jgi:hypothetical protein